MAGPIQKFFTNVVCLFIWNKRRRKKVRVILNSPTLSQLRFIRKNIGEPIRSVKFFIGYKARNMLIGVNKKYVFKFPLRRTHSNYLATREVAIINTLRRNSTMTIPDVVDFTWRDKIVRRYDWVHGHTLRGLPLDVALAHTDKWARQIAEFVYKMSSVDPQDIRRHKSDPKMRPGFMTGWFHNDISDNFIIDPDTMDVTAFIDWEDADFVDFSGYFLTSRRAPSHQLLQAVAREYVRIWNECHGDNKTWPDVKIRQD